MMKGCNVFYVYQLRLAGQLHPFYVGKGKGNRAYDHFKPKNLKPNTRKVNTIKKATEAGVEVLVEYIQTSLSEESAFIVEADIIAKYGRLDIGTGCLTNLTTGGEGFTGGRHSIASKEAIAAALRGREVTETTRAKISEACEGRVYKPNTEVQKAKISDALSGRILTASTKTKMSASASLRPTMKCDHCGKEAKNPTFSRWHGINCKLNSYRSS